jgi:hypothetical protein
MSGFVILAIVCLLVALCGTFVYTVNASYAGAGRILAALAVIVLFPMAVKVI